MAASTQRTVRTPDGRTLAIEEAGDPGGHPVLVHNGTPNSRHLYGPAAADAATSRCRPTAPAKCMPGWRIASDNVGSTEADLIAAARHGDEADDTVYHTYSAYARGGDATRAMWQWLDRAPLGRNEGDMSWFHRHDEYPA